MHIEYRVSEGDYRNATTLANKKRSNLSALEHFWPYLFVIVWLSIGFLPASISGSSGEDVDMYFALGVIPIWIIFLYMRKLQFRREYAKLPNLKLLQALDLDSNGLRLVTTAATTRTSWDLYNKFAEDQHAFVLYMDGGHNFLPITKSYMNTLQIDELRTLLKANIRAPEAVPARAQPAT